MKFSWGGLCVQYRGIDRLTQKIRGRGGKTARRCSRQVTQMQARMLQHGRNPLRSDGTGGCARTGVWIWRGWGLGATSFQTQTDAIRGESILVAIAADVAALAWSGASTLLARAQNAVNSEERRGSGSSSSLLFQNGDTWLAAIIGGRSLTLGLLVLGVLLLEDRLQSLAQVAALLRVQEHGGGQVIGGRVARRSWDLPWRLLLLAEIAGRPFEGVTRRRGICLYHLCQHRSSRRGRRRRGGAGRAHDGDLELGLRGRNVGRGAGSGGGGASTASSRGPQWGENFEEVYEAFE